MYQGLNYPVNGGAGAGCKGWNGPGYLVKPKALFAHEVMIRKMLINQVGL